jgi:succinylglutamate desuccinylase
MRKVRINESFYYYTHGKNPKLLIHTGTHGDEHAVIEIAKLAVEKYENELPSFVFVPEVFHAVLKKTRNWANRDMNRSFMRTKTILKFRQILRF